jgi:excisionase family DNA binding protein
MAIEFPEVMTIDEMSQYLRIPRSSLYKLAQEGKIPCQKVGRHWRFRKAAIDRWLDDGILVSGQGAQTSDEDMHGN